MGTFLLQLFSRFLLAFVPLDFLARLVLIFFSVAVLQGGDRDWLILVCFPLHFVQVFILMLRDLRPLRLGPLFFSPPPFPE